MRFVLLVAVIGLLGLAHGRQQYRGRIPNGIAIPCPPGDPACEENELCEGFGHKSCAGGAVTPRLNAFGKVILFCASLAIKMIFECGGAEPIYFARLFSGCEINGGAEGKEVSVNIRSHRVLRMGVRMCYLTNVEQGEGVKKVVMGLLGRTAGDVWKP